MKVDIITGERDSGKSTRFLELLDGCPADDIAICSQKIMERGTTIGYNLTIKPEDREYEFIKLSASSSCDDADVYHQGHYVFLKDTFNIVEKHITNHPRPSRIWIDEIGKLELQGKGFFNVLSYIASQDINMVIVVRTRYKEDVKQMLSSLSASCNHTINFEECQPK
jgi:nucleoside-triphosphatase THEP1